MILLLFLYKASSFLLLCIIYLFIIADKNKEGKKDKNRNVLFSFVLFLLLLWVGPVILFTVHSQRNSNSDSGAEQAVGTALAVFSSNPNVVAGLGHRLEW